MCRFDFSNSSEVDPKVKEEVEKYWENSSKAKTKDAYQKMPMKGMDSEEFNKVLEGLYEVAILDFYMEN